MDEKATADIESASRELRLTEQSIFRDILQTVRGRHRRILVWTVIALLVMGTIWTFALCPGIHHRIGWCPMHHTSP